MKYAVNPVNNVKFFPFYATETGFYDKTKRYSDQLCAVYSDRISGINPENGPYCGGSKGFFTVAKEHETDGLSESVSYEFKVLLKRVADENAQLAQSDPRVQKELQMLRMIKIYIVDGEVNTNPGFSASIEACLQELYSGKYHLYYEGFFEETIDKEKQLQAIREATASNAMRSMLFFSEAGGAFDYGLPLTVILEEDSSQTELTEIETPYSKVDEFRISIDSEDHPTSSYIWSCESELEELKIPEVFYIDIPLTSVHSMSQNGYVKRIELPPSVSELESRAFESMSALESVVIAGEVQEISGSCFNYCSVLNDVQLNSATERIMPYAFSGCNALTRINLEHVKTISEKSFSECYDLKDLELTDLETMDKSAFCSCMGLVSVNMPKLQEIPEFAFEDCSALTEVKLSPQIRRIEHCAFLGCTQLKEIYIGESIEYIDEGAFEEGITFVSDTPIEVIRNLLGGVREFSYRLSDGTKVLSEWEQRQADALAEEEAEEAQIAALKQEEKAETIAAMKSLAGQVKSVLQDKTRHKILFDETDRSASFQDVFRQLADSYTGRDKAMISAYFLDNDSLLENDFEVCLVLLKEMADITANLKEVTQPKEEPTAPASPLAGMGAMGDAIARARAAAVARMQEVAAQGSPPIPTIPNMPQAMMATMPTQTAQTNVSVPTPAEGAHHQDSKTKTDLSKGLVMAIGDTGTSYLPFSLDVSVIDGIPFEGNVPIMLKGNTVFIAHAEKMFSINLLSGETTQRDVPAQVVVSVNSSTKKQTEVNTLKIDKNSQMLQILTSIIDINNNVQDIPMINDMISSTGLDLMLKTNEQGEVSVSDSEGSAHSLQEVVWAISFL